MYQIIYFTWLEVIAASVDNNNSGKPMITCVMPILLMNGFPIVIPSSMDSMQISKSISSWIYITFEMIIEGASKETFPKKLFLSKLTNLIEFAHK